MKTATANNAMGSRSLRHVNLLLCPGQGIVEFTGKDIPPVLRVVKEDYTRNGKWSHSTWTVEIQDDFELLAYGQDWEMGKFFPGKTWPEALKRLNSKLDGKPAKMGITEAMMERAIRSIFPKSAAAIDAAEAEFANAGNALAELLAAQDELSAARKAEAEVLGQIRQMEEAEKMRQEAAETRARVERANSLLKSGQKISLADLKNAIGATA